jgi:hypothetical protein
MLANIKTLAIGQEAEALLISDMRPAGFHAEYFPHPGRVR